MPTNNLAASACHVPTPAKEPTIVDAKWQRHLPDPATQRRFLFYGGARISVEETPAIGCVRTGHLLSH
eukprot:12512117-Prorocentrum_lima.AAC.1